MEHDTKIDTLKMGAGAAAGVYSYFTLNEWVAIFTILYLLLQIGLLLPKYWQAVSVFFSKDKK
jgi:hypothetical protein